MSDVQRIVAQKLASRALTETQLEDIVKKISTAPYPIVDINICTHGICLDFAAAARMEEIDIQSLLGVATGTVDGIEIFPEGMPRRDQTRIRLTQSL